MITIHYSRTRVCFECGTPIDPEAPDEPGTCDECTHDDALAHAYLSCVLLGMTGEQATDACARAGLHRTFNRAPDAR